MLSWLTSLTDAPPLASSRVMEPEFAVATRLLAERGPSWVRSPVVVIVTVPVEESPCVKLVPITNPEKRVVVVSNRVILPVTLPWRIPI